MLNNKNPIVIILILTLTVFGCSKQQESLILDKDYLTVSDLLQYCQGSCDELLEWENKDALVKGHIISIGVDSIMNNYYDDSRLFLLDIRNGKFMEVRIIENKDPIFEKIRIASKKNLFYIKGETESIIALTDSECVKGVVLKLSHPNDIYFE